MCKCGKGTNKSHQEYSVRIVWSLDFFRWDSYLLSIIGIKKHIVSRRMVDIEVLLLAIILFSFTDVQNKNICYNTSLQENKELISTELINYSKMITIPSRAIIEPILRNNVMKSNFPPCHKRRKSGRREKREGKTKKGITHIIVMINPVTYSTTDLNLEENTICFS